MNKVIGRIAKFRINPGTYNPYKPSFKHYYQIHVFDIEENMWEYGYRLTRNEERIGGYTALTIPTWRERFDSSSKLWIIAPKIGDVLFHKERLDITPITHESVHLATSFLRILSKLRLNDQIDDDEEMLAYCVGSLASQIVDKLTHLKIL